MKCNNLTISYDQYINFTALQSLDQGSVFQDQDLSPKNSKPAFKQQKSEHDRYQGF